MHSIGSAETSHLQSLHRTSCLADAPWSQDGTDFDSCCGFSKRTLCILNHSCMLICKPNRPCLCKSSSELATQEGVSTCLNSALFMIALDYVRCCSRASRTILLYLLASLAFMLGSCTAFWITCLLSVNATSQSKCTRLLATFRDCGTSCDCSSLSTAWRSCTLASVLC